MPSETPWEWVDGDSIRSTQYRIVFRTIQGVLLALVLVNFLILAGTWGVATGFPLVGFTLMVPALALLLAGLFFLNYMARRFPVISPLGVSTKGVRLILPPGGRTYYWGEVSRVGPDWIDVSSFGLLTTRYKLTIDQIDRVYRLLQSH